jgi:hypothetical protein
MHTPSIVNLVVTGLVASSTVAGYNVGSNRALAHLVSANLGTVLTHKTGAMNTV